MVIEGAGAVFVVGCAGGAVAELLHWWGLRQTVQLPAYRSSLFYWGITIAMILAGGLMAWLYFGDSAEGLVVAHVGLATPLILQKLATSIPQQPGAKNVILNPAPTLRRFFTW